MVPSECIFGKFGLEAALAKVILQLAVSIKAALGGAGIGRDGPP